MENRQKYPQQCFANIVFVFSQFLCWKIGFMNRFDIKECVKGLHYFVKIKARSKRCWAMWGHIKWTLPSPTVQEVCSCGFQSSWARFNPARSEQNMLPHTFLVGLERRGKTEEVKREGERGRRQVYRWQKRRKAKDFLFGSIFAVAALKKFWIWIALGPKDTQRIVVLLTWLV